MLLNDSQIERYSRQIILDEIGGRGQKKLAAAKVLVIGTGGLGSPAGFYLAAAGVGTIGLVDHDVVELSNLQRQIAHSTLDLGRAKTASAAEKFRILNPEIEIIPHSVRFSPETAVQLLAEYDFILDCLDNFPGKFLVADACHILNKPYSHAGILKFSGQAITVIPGRTCCYRCIFNEPPPPESVPTCSQAGVIGTAAGIIGSIQATEAIKYILGRGELLTDRLLSVDTLNMQFRSVRFKRAPDCRLCGAKADITGLEIQPAKPETGNCQAIRGRCKCTGACAR